MARSCSNGGSGAEGCVGCIGVLIGLIIIAAIFTLPWFLLAAALISVGSYAGWC